MKTSIISTLFAHHSVTCNPSYLCICQLDSRKALVALFYSCNVILAGAVL